MIEISREIETRQEALDWFLAEHFPAPAAPERPARPTPVGPPRSGYDRSLSDDEILDRAPNAVNGQKFARLFNGDCSGYRSQSEADQALCNMLAFWCRCDAEQMDRLFLLSGLANREKAGRADYRARTIRKAIADCREVYSGRQDRGYESTGGAFADFAGLGGQGEQAGQGRGSAPPDDRAAALARIEERITYINIREALAAPPPPRQFIVEGCLPAGIVAALSGEGGSGKSYLAELMAVAIASGRSVPPFTVVTPATVLFVSVEDDELALQGRLYRIEQEIGLSPAEQDQLHANLVIASARGVLGALMEFDEARNPRPAMGTDWLRMKMEEVQPALVILDTKSRLFGLQENSNDDGAAWVSNLESLLVDHTGASFLVISHVGKKNEDEKTKQYGARGASAFVDNCRAVFAFVGASEAEKKRLRATDIGPVHKLVHAKASYSKPQDDAFFVKNPWGVPVYIDAESARDENLSAALDELMDVLLVEKPEGVNKKKLVRGTETEFKRIRNLIVETTGIKLQDLEAVINLGVESGRLIEEREEDSPARNKPVNIKAKGAMQEKTAHEPEQQTLIQTGEIL
jgi:RecA-family ATPase